MEALYTFKIRLDKKPVAPPFVGTAPLVMVFVGRTPSSVVRVDAEDCADGGVVYSAQSYADSENMPSPQLGWVVDSAFIISVGV